MKLTGIEKIINWFGNRGIPLTTPEIKFMRTYKNVLFIQLDLINDGLFWSSTEPGEYDVLCLDSSCAELWDTIKGPLTEQKILTMYDKINQHS